MTTFIWPYDGNQVSLAGTFNDWTPQPMKREKDVGFTLTVPLENGVYQYKYVVDGRRWCYDLELPSSQDDRGNRNNVIEVGAVRPKGGSGGAAHPPAKGKGSTPAPAWKGDVETKSQPKEVQTRSPPRTQEPHHEEKKSGDDGAEDVVSDVGGSGGAKQQQNQKQQNQKQQNQKQQKQQNQKQQNQQQKVQYSAVARSQSANLIKIVKSNGVPFYVGDVECETTEDAVAIAELFQKALPDTGCMVVSGGVDKFIVVGVVPEGKSITALELVNSALSIESGHQATGTNTLAQGEIPANPDAGVFPIKLKDLCRGPVFALLRKAGLVQEEVSEDEMYFFDE